MKIMIISPHMDDEILGTFSFLSLMDSEPTIVLYCAIDEVKCPPDPKHRLHPKAKREECEKVAERMLFTPEFLSYQNGNRRSLFKVNLLYEMKYDLIKEIERKINKHKPDLLLIPQPSINQDHQTVYEASLVASRHHDKNFFVKRVLIYESPQDFLWKPLDCNYFREVNIDRKIEIYKLYKSQVRKHRSEEIIRDIAYMRGTQSKQFISEGFKVLRWVE